MRALIVFAVLVAGCSSAQVSGLSVRQPIDLPTAGRAETPSPIAATRGSAIPPPQTAANAGRPAPPQGVGPGGIDFGQWRGAEPETYAATFQSQMQARYAAGGAAARPDLERNGFACADRPNVLECRLEISENACAKEWYVVFEQARAQPVAGFDVMCATRR